MKFNMNNMKIHSLVYFLSFIKKNKGCTILEINKQYGTYSHIYYSIMSMKDKNLVIIKRRDGRSYSLYLTKKGKSIERALRRLND